MEKQHISLSELNFRIREAIQDNFSEGCWVVAEINEININRKGHCYLELIDKDVINNKITARARGTIWSFTYRMLKAYFESETGKGLERGIKILVKVNVQYHEQYGLSLNITDIDPVYTMGDLAKRRQETINRLKEEGIFDMNKETVIPELPQRIAIISSPTAAGFGDFVNQLDNNEANYKLHHKLFPANMQGNEAVGSVINALDQIYNYDDFFDVVVLIRGGGSKTDLACFDEYDIAVNIAQFPLPVITGIGHERDESIADMVANTSLKTPTAVAEYLINCFSDAEAHINQLRQNIVDLSRNILSRESEKLKIITRRFQPLIRVSISEKENKLLLYGQILLNSTTKTLNTKRRNITQFQNKISQQAQSTIKNNARQLETKTQRLNTGLKILFIEEANRLNMFGNKLELLKPEAILKRGYSITRKNGKVITSSNNLEKGDEIETILLEGTILSSVVGKQP